MKRAVIIFSLFFACTGILCAADSASLKPVAPPPAAPKFAAFLPKLADSPFSIAYPENWFVREDPLPWKGTTALFISREPLKEAEDQYLVGMGTIVLGVYFTAQNADFKIGMESFVGNLQAKGARVDARKTLSVSGHPALLLESTRGDAKVTGLMVQDGRELYLFEFRAPAGEFEAYRPAFQKMIESLRWQKTPKS